MRRNLVSVVLTTALLAGPAVLPAGQAFAATTGTRLSATQDAGSVERPGTGHDNADRKKAAAKAKAAEKKAAAKARADAARAKAAEKKAAAKARADAARAKAAAKKTAAKARADAARAKAAEKKAAHNSGS
jgi:hypothetical protein